MTCTKGMGTDTISVEIVYALPGEQKVIALDCAVGTTIARAIEDSGIAFLYPELAGREYEVGVHGYRQDPDFVLSHHDRVEIYRPLLVPPTEARRLRARARERIGK